MRPKTFDQFVWQTHIKNILTTAINSSKIRDVPMWHSLFFGASGYGKTTLATIASSQLGSRIKIITWYALSKPSELVSLLHLLWAWDILFIDEIHRLRAPVEEVLYTAMEDYCIDMVMPDGHHVRLPVEPFTLIWATTKLESLSLPLKNRFVYHFHMQSYTHNQKKQLIQRYLDIHQISYPVQLLEVIARHISSVPRNITTICHQLKDYLTTHYQTSGPVSLDTAIRKQFRERTDMDMWWITKTHVRYLTILQGSPNLPVWLTTLSAKLGMSPKAIESDIEPLLLEMGRIQKTSRWRIAVRE